MSRPAGSAVDFLPFSKLTQEHLAPRVRSLLEGTYQASWPDIESALHKSVDALDGDLFRHAERARNTAEQTTCFDSLRVLRRHKGAFVLACRDGLQRAVLGMVERKPALESSTSQVASPQLSLVESNVLEEDLTLNEIAARAEIRASSALQSLGYRLAVIAGGAPPDMETLAIGPQRLCCLVRDAAQCFDVILPHRIALYRRIDKILFLDPAGFYDGINQFLVGQRVLPNLQLARRSPARLTEPIPAPPNVAEPRAERPGSSPEEAAAAAPEPTKPSFLGPAADAFRGLLDEHQEAPASAPPGVDQEVDERFFDSMRELLAGRRRRPDRHEASQPQAQAQDLQSVLTALQSQPPKVSMVDGKVHSRTVADIKQEMQSHLRSLGGEQGLRIREEDSDTIDLIGFLFDHLLADYRPTSLSHGLITRLQVPLLKVALKDKAFFTRRNHPARQLLNAIAEASAYWVEDEDQDRPVIERMQVVVDRVLQEYDDDIGVFDRLFGDLSRHISGLQKKAEVAERRQVEAAKGRDKLELARAVAQESIQQRIFDFDPVAEVRSFLENAWADVIALSLLRQGVDHPQTAKRLELVDCLMQALHGTASAQQRLGMLETLRSMLEEGLAAIGFHDDAIATVWANLTQLIVPAGSAAVATESASAMTALLRDKPRLGGEARAHPPLVVDSGSADKDAASAQAPEPATPSSAEGPATILGSLRKSERIPLGPRELEMVEKIKRLPFGTWLEFTINQQGDTQRRKLCWFSPVTGRCLLVNARGAKAEERMIEGLARDMLRGNVRVAQESSENLLDRTWKGIMAMLKGVGLGTREADAAAAN